MTTNKSAEEMIEAARRTADAILAKWDANPETDPTRNCGRMV